MRLFLLASVTLVLLSSCGKPYDDVEVPAGAKNREKCHAFDPILISTWMPYEMLKTYYYNDSNGVKYALTVDSEDYSEEYWVTFYTSCSEYGGIYALADTADTFDIDMNVSYYSHAGDPGGPVLSINWMGARMDFSYHSSITDTLRPKLPNDNKNVSVKDKMNFGGKDYYIVHELSVKHDKLQKLYIVKGHGVVAFLTTDNKLYWLIE
jgi:hypothetical protein